MSLHLIYDDTAVVPAGLRALVGVDRYGSLVFQRRSRLEAMRSLAAAAGAQFVHLHEVAERAALLERLREADLEETFLLCASHIVPVSSEDALSVFLKQLQYVPTAMYVPVEGTRDRSGWLLMRTGLLSQFLLKQEQRDVAGFFDQYAEAFVEVRDRVRLIDVSEERTLLDFLSGQFDARHFNAIAHDEYTVTKRSRDRAKMKREFDFYRLVPPQMQMFLVQPFDFQDDGTTASYRMERLCVPDMALQWMHAAFSPAEFERFLAHIFHFFSIRSERRAAKAEAHAVQQALYVDKVRSRIEMLERAPEYAALRPLLERACGGIAALVDRYLALWDRMRRRLPCDRLVAGHGDPCFSNVLYSKSSQYLKLIDPRGAESEADLYTDPYYDIAKLSHSVVGNYDFINLGKFDIHVDERLHLRLQIENPPAPWAAELFRRHLTRAGYDFELTRLCEASLFISMMPLHIDRPRKVLGFAINAANLLDELTGEGRKNT
ncbi:MAG TPA: hypothetical protein VGE08_13725 [Steroidobacter sp.]|uniref:hypothetical protein n=1 Tax=Steroidobacter sp. TaxID=1978227 RepID=UPI002ED83575